MPGSASLSSLPAPAVSCSLVRVPPPLSPLFDVDWSDTRIALQRRATHDAAAAAAAAADHGALLSAQIYTRQPHVVLYRGTATLFPGGASGSPAASPPSPPQPDSAAESAGPAPPQQQQQQQALQIPVLIKCIQLPPAGSGSSGTLPLSLLRELHHSLKLEWLLFHHHSKLSLQASQAAAGAGSSTPAAIERQQQMTSKHSPGDNHAAAAPTTPGLYRVAAASDAPVSSPSSTDRAIDPSVPAHYRLGLLGPLGFPRWVVAPANPQNTIVAPSLQATVDPTDPVWPRVAAATIAAAASFSTSPPVMRSTNIHSGMLLSNSSHDRHVHAARPSSMRGNEASPESPNSSESLSPLSPPPIPFAEMAPQGGWSDGVNGGGWPADSQPVGSLDRASLTLVLPDVGGESLDRLIAARLFTDVPPPAVAGGLPAGTAPIAPSLNVRLAVFLRAALAIVDQICALHSIGIISKALRPSAISYNPHLHLAQLLDFSQATLLAKENMSISWVGSNVSGGGGGGAMLHVPPHQRAYMSPEESGRVSRVIDTRADIYQLGMVMFEMIAGRTAFAPATTTTAATTGMSTSASSSGLAALDALNPPPPGPAAEEDVMAIIHAHLAREPVFPPHIHGPRSNVSVDITDAAVFSPAAAAPAPGADAADTLASRASYTTSQIGLSAFALVKKIILTCLSKMVEERYSSAAGLRADLLYVLGLLAGKEPRSGFEVGHMDRHSTFMVSQKLYGREVQHAAMLECFERAARSGAALASKGSASGNGSGSGSGNGSGGVAGKKKHHASTGPEILLVSGYSGIGKTALIELVHRPMVSRSAIYSKAKFDLYRRSHSAIFLAFDALFAHFAVAEGSSAGATTAAAAAANLEAQANLASAMAETTRSKLVPSVASAASAVSISSSNSWKQQLLATLELKQLQMLVAVMPNLALIVGVERDSASAAAGSTTKDSNVNAASRDLRIQLNSGEDDHVKDDAEVGARTGASTNPTTPALGAAIATPSAAPAAASVPPASEMAPIEAQNLFTVAFLALVGVFATPAHPLVLFLDDVQWIDSTSLDLLRKLHGNKKLTMLIICAYRSNEVDPLHPFIRTIQSLADMDKTEADGYVTVAEANSGRDDLLSRLPPLPGEAAVQAQLSIKLSPRIHQVILPPLSKQHVMELIRDTAGIVEPTNPVPATPGADTATVNNSRVGLYSVTTSPFSPTVPTSKPSASSDVHALAELLHEQTSGNPFFIANLLIAYVAEGFIHFDFDALRWTWNIDELRVTKLAHLDSVIDLLCGVVAQLPARHQILLQRAACVGNTATLQQLAIISEATEIETAQHIWHLCQLGFLVPLQPASATFAVATSTAPTPPAAAEAAVSSPMVSPNQSSTNSPASSIASVSSGGGGPLYPVLCYSFLHDSVQQSCYQLMSPNETKMTHLRIARLFDAQGSTTPIPALHAQLAPKYTQAFLLEQQPPQQSQDAATAAFVPSTVSVSHSVEWAQLVYDIVEQYNLPARDCLLRAQQQKGPPGSPPPVVTQRPISAPTSPSSLSLSSPQELKRIIELNLISGIGAKAATAYAHALRYLTLAHELWSHLDETARSGGAVEDDALNSLWTVDHDLSVDLHVHLIQCLTMNDLFERAEQLSNIALAHVEHAPVAERVRILRTKVSMYILQQSRTRDSLKVGLQILPLLGISLPDPASPESAALRLKDPSIFLDQASTPLMRDPLLIEVCDVMVSLLSPCFQLGELAIMERILLHLLAMSYEFGVHASTAFVLVMKMAFDWREEAMDASRLSGKVSQLLVYERSDLRASSSAYMRIRVISLYHHFCHWFVPLSEMLPTMLDCVTEGVSCGETEYAGYCLWIWIYLRFYRGEPLTAFAHAMRSLRASLLKQRRHLHASYCHYTLRMILHLQTGPVFSVKPGVRSMLSADSHRDHNGSSNGSGAPGVQFVTLTGDASNGGTANATPMSSATPPSPVSASPPKSLPLTVQQRIQAEASIGSAMTASHAHHHHTAHPTSDGVPSTFEFNGHVYRDSDVEAFLIAGSSSTWLCHLYELYMIWAYLHRCWPQAWEERERARPLLKAMAGMYDHSVNNFYGSLILLAAVDMNTAALHSSPGSTERTEEHNIAALTAKNTEANSSMQDTQAIVDPLTGKPVQLGTWTSAQPSLDIDYAAAFSYASVVAQVSSNQRLLHLWAKHSPSSFQHKADLVDAEWMRVRYQHDGAHELLLLIMDKYDAAIRGARRYGFLQERAMASECAARFYLSLRPARPRDAKRHMEAAYRSYRKWNCVLKMELLLREFPYLREMEAVGVAAAMLRHSAKQPMLHPTPGILPLRGALKDSSSKHRRHSPSPDRAEFDRAAARSSRRKREAHSTEMPPQPQLHGRMGSSTSHGRNSSAQHAARGDRIIMMGDPEVVEAARVHQVDRDKARVARRSRAAPQHGTTGTDDESAVSLAEQSDRSQSEAHFSDGSSPDSELSFDAHEPLDVGAIKSLSTEEDDEKDDDAHVAFGRATKLPSPRHGGGDDSTSVTSSEATAPRPRHVRLSGETGVNGGRGESSPVSTQETSTGTPVKADGGRYSLTRISSSDYSTSEEISRRRRRDQGQQMREHINDKKDGPGVDINLLSVMRATQAFSVITDSKLLHQTLLRIVLQASCASRARLILRQEAPLTSASTDILPDSSPQQADEEENRLFVPRLCVSLVDESASTRKDRSSAAAAVTGPSSTPATPNNTSGSPEWSGEHEHIYVQELSGLPTDLGAALPLSVHKMALNSRSAVLLNFDDIASEQGLFGKDAYFAKFRILVSNPESQANAAGGGSGDTAATANLKRDAASGTLHSPFPTPQSPSSSFGSSSLDGVSVISATGGGTFGWRGPRSCLYIPLIRQGYVCGALYFEHDHYARDGFSTQHIQLLQQLGAQAVLSMDNARLYSRMRHAMEEAESGSRAKTSFLQNMSHEIRTPLNAMLGAASMLSDFDIPPEQMQLVDMLQSSGQLLLSIISDILDLSRIESGSLTLEQRPFRLGETLEDVVHMLYAFAQQRRLDLTLHLEPDLPDALIGDAIHLQQVIINLVNNSLKFTPRGGVMILVKQITHDNALEDAAQHHGAPLQTVINQAARRATSDGSAASGARSSSVTPLPSPPPIWLRISVRDTGIGVSAAVIPKLFSSFVQADASTVRRFGGSGLGLAISKRLVCAMGGCIWMESQEGQGTVVHLDVPFFTAAGAGALPISPPTHHILSTPTKGLPMRQLSAGKSPRPQDMVTSGVLAMRGSSDSIMSPMRGLGGARTDAGSSNTSAASSRHSSPALSSKQHPPLDMTTFSGGLGSPAIAMQSLLSPPGTTAATAAAAAAATGSRTPPIPRRLEASAIRFDLSPLAIQTLCGKRVLVICPLDASRQMTTEILQSVGMLVAATASLSSVASSYSELCAMASPKLQQRKGDSPGDSLDHLQPSSSSSAFDLVLCDMFDPQTCAAETAQLVTLFACHSPDNTSSHSSDHHSVPTPGLLCAMLPLRQTSPFGLVRSVKTNGSGSSSRLFPSTPASLVQMPSIPNTPASSLRSAVVAAASSSDSIPTRTAVVAPPAATTAFMNRSVSAPQRRLDEVQETEEVDGASSSPDPNAAARSIFAQVPSTGDSAGPLEPSPPAPLANLSLPAAAGMPLRTTSEASADEPVVPSLLPPLHATDSRHPSQASQFSSVSSSSSPCGLLELHKPIKTCLLLQLLAAHLASAFAAKKQQQTVSTPSSSRPLPTSVSLLHTSSLSDQLTTPDGSLIFAQQRGPRAPFDSQLSLPSLAPSNLAAPPPLESAVAFSPVLPDHVVDRVGPALFPLSLPSSGPNSAAASPTTATSSALSVSSTPSTAASTPHSLSSASTTPSAAAGLSSRAHVTLLGSGQSVDTSAMSSPSSRTRTLRSSGAPSSHAMSSSTGPGSAHSTPSASSSPDAAAAVSSTSSFSSSGPTGSSSLSKSAGVSGSSKAPLLFASCPLNVLLVDDNLVNLKMLSMVLRKQGYSCDTAANGQIAIDKVEAKWAEDEAHAAKVAAAAAAETNAAAAAAASAASAVVDTVAPPRRHSSYDLLVMDVCMDVMDGLECTIYLRAHQRPAPARRPFIIAHTADSTPESKAKCAAAGAECFLPKPFHQDQLITFIKQAHAYHQKRATDAAAAAATAARDAAESDGASDGAHAQSS